jgi:hypothetical protein
MRPIKRHVTASISVAASKNICNSTCGVRRLVAAFKALTSQRTPKELRVTNSNVESLADRMAGIEKQDHDPGVEQQLQANRLVKEPGHCYRQKVAERHTN